MDFIDEKDLAFADVAEDAGEVELLLQDGSRGLIDGCAEFLGDDVCECGFAESRRAIKQYVIERLTAAVGSLNRDGQVLFEFGLTGEIRQPGGPQTYFELT